MRQKEKWWPHVERLGMSPFREEKEFVLPFAFNGKQSNKFRAGSTQTTSYEKALSVNEISLVYSSTILNTKNGNWSTSDFNPPGKRRFEYPKIRMDEGFSTFLLRKF